MSAGETDLGLMLRTLSVRRRPGEFVVTTLPMPPVTGEGVEAVLREEEGFTVVATRSMAAENGWAYDFVAAWLTLEVHSSLEAVGLTASVTAALADHGIAGNVLAGHFHDHVLVPLDRVDDAIAALDDLRQAQPDAD